MRLALSLLLPVLLAGPALTASSTVPPSVAGAGAGVVSGYTVASIAYAVDGETIEAVSFALSPPGAASVQARLAPGEPWTPCSLIGAGVSCPVGTPVVAATSLDVVATG